MDDQCVPWLMNSIEQPCLPATNMTPAFTLPLSASLCLYALCCAVNGVCAWHDGTMPDCSRNMRLLISAGAQQQLGGTERWGGEEVVCVCVRTCLQPPDCATAAAADRQGACPATHTHTHTQEDVRLTVPAD